MTPGTQNLFRKRSRSTVFDCHVTRVETEADFIGSLEQGGFDLILADYTLPSFDGLSALKIARQESGHMCH